MESSVCFWPGVLNFFSVRSDSKYGHDCLTSFVQLRDVDLTITDNSLPRAKAKTLEAVGAKLRIAEVVDKAHLKWGASRRLGRFNSDRNTFREQANAYSAKRETLVRLARRFSKISQDFPGYDLSGAAVYVFFEAYTAINGALPVT